MKEVKAFICEHCHKVYLRAHACKEHEQNRCTENPEIRPLCYSCEHYVPSTLEDERDEIEYEVYVDWYGDEHYQTKSFTPNKCSHPSKDCKLYNNMKLSDKMTEALSENGYQPMPTRRTGGCELYKPLPDHPDADKQLKSDS